MIFPLKFFSSVCSDSLNFFHFGSNQCFLFEFLFFLIEKGSISVWLVRKQGNYKENNTNFEVWFWKVKGSSNFSLSFCIFWLIFYSVIYVLETGVHVEQFGYPDGKGFENLVWFSEVGQ